MTISATCTVQDGGGSPVDPTGVGVDVTPSNTITIRLADVSGVDIWTLTVLGTDETIAAPTLSVNSTTKTATYTCTASTGTCVLFRSRATSINGIDPVTGRPGPYVVDYTFTVHTLVSGKRVGAVNETFESNATVGTAAKINPAIRSGGGASTPTGTGLPHIVGGVQNAAASLVVNADVDPAAAIVGSKLAATLDLTTALTIGTKPVASYTGSPVLILGDSVSSNGTVLLTSGGGVQWFRFGGTDAAYVSLAGFQLGKPCFGSADGFSDSPYGINGERTSITLSGTTYTEIAANFSRKRLTYTGTPGGACTITMPAPPSADAYYEKTVYNNTTGGFAIVMTTGTGATITIANGKQAVIGFGSTRTWRITADIDPTT